MNIKQYYTKIYGNPSREAKFVTKEEMDINIYKWSNTKEGVTIYATNGASNFWCKKNIGYEFFIGLSPEMDSVVNSMAEVAIFGKNNNNLPLKGETIKLPINLWKGTPMNNYLLEDGKELIPNLDESSKIIQFIQLIPLFDDEIGYIRKKGIDDMWLMFENKFVKYWCPNRKSSCSNG